MSNLESSLSITDLQAAIIRNPLVVTADTLMMEAITQMSNTTLCASNAEEQQEPLYLEARSSCVLVMEADCIVGIITERDVVLLSAQQRSLDNLTVREVMVAPVVTLREADFTDLFAAVNLFQQYHIRHIPILDQGDRLLGIVTHESLWKLMQPVYPSSVKQTSELSPKVENEQINAQVSARIAASFYRQARTALFERQRTEAALKVQIDFNQLIAEITSRFVDVHPNELDAEINHSLQLIGEITQVDTSYIFHYDDVNLTTSMTYEWSKKDISSQIALAQNIPCWTLFPWSSQILMQRDIVYIRDVNDLPAEAAIDQANWKQLNLASILMIPLVQKSVTTGSIGFSSFSQPLVLDDKTVRLLQVLGQTIINAQARSQDENKIYESEERLRLALNAANQGLYDLNLQTGYALVSPEYAAMLGYDHATFEESNAKWIERLHPDDREAVAKVYQEYIAGKLPEYKVEFRQLTHSGEWKWILSLGKIVEWDEAGNPLRMLGTHTDIHDRKQAEEQAQRRLVILEAARDIIASVDVNGYVLYLNQSGRSLLGIQPDEDLSHTQIPDYHPPEIAELILQEALPQCVQKGFWSGETLLRRRDGSTFPVLQMIVCHRGSDNNVEQFSTIARDISDRKQSEEALLQLNQELEAKVIERTQELWQVNSMQRAILDSADYSFISTAPDGTIQSFNAAAERMLGYSAYEVIGKVTPAILHDPQEVVSRAASLSVELNRDIPVGFEVFVAKARLGLVSEEEWTYIRKDGSRLPVLLSVTALRDFKQRITGFLGIAKDISERKRAEISLKRYENIVSSTKDGIALLDHNYTYQIVNQAYLNWCNKSFDEVIGASVRDILGAELFDTYVKQLLDQCLGGQTVQYEKWFDYPNVVPQFLSVTYTPYLDLNKNIAGIIVSLRDITNLKQAEVAIQESESRFRYLADYAPVMIWMSGLDKLYFHFNRPWLEFTGRTIEEEVEYGWEELIHPEDRQFYIDSYEDIFDTHQSFSVEYRYRRFDGEYRWLLSTGIPRFDADGEFLGYIGSCIDISDRKQAEAQLQESKAELERFFSVTLDLLCIADLEGYFCRLNQAWEKTLGYTIAELEGQKYLDFVHPDDVAATIESMSVLRAQDAVIAFVNRYRCKDGTYRYIEWYSRPYGNSVYAAARDITNRKYAEEEILEKQRFIQKIADASPNILYLYDIQEQRNVYCNREVASVLGYTSAEIQAMGADLFSNLMHPDDLAKMPNYYQQIEAAQDGDIFEIEYRMRHVDGEYHWLYSRDSIFSRDEQGHPKQTIGTAQDISDRKQADVALRNLSDRLTLAVKSGALGIWDWDIPHNILRWDDRMYELYGLKPEQFANAYEAWASTLHPEDRLNTENAIQQALRGEKEYDPEFRVLLPDGTSRFIKAYSLVQRNEQGEPLRMVGINLDISDRKRAEITIQQTTAQLEASNRELEAFAYSVSHDLRAPLRAIDGFSNALMEDYADKFDEDGRDYFERIRRNIQRMGMLIDDLLRLSRVSRSEMQYSKVNLSALAQEQIHDLRESDPQRQVEVVIAPDLCVTADVTLMRVIISNLIQNAWKFTSHHATARIEFGVIQQEGELIYFVRDDGAGFDMNYTKMLFGVFQRLHNTNEFPGTGIGLATVQRVVHRHGGRVWAEGEVEKGATIYFTVPNIPVKI